MAAAFTDEEIEDRFLLLGRMEILHTLNDLIHRREAVSVRFNAGNDFFQTTLLEARPEALIFDLGGDEKTNQRFGQSQTCVFVARPDGIRVQFAGGTPRRFSWGGSDAFWVSLPERVIRLQRRESYRILMPVARPRLVRLRTEAGGREFEWQLHDLSVGGFGAGFSGTPPFEPGQPLAELNLFLPEHGEVVCAGLLRHVTLLSESETGARYRFGVRFVGLSRGMEVSIQRHIIDVEHERRALPAA